MVELQLNLWGDGAWEALKGRQIETIRKPLRIAGLKAGTVQGNPTVGLCFESEDGRIFFAETTLKLFLAAADALRISYGNPR